MVRVGFKHSKESKALMSINRKLAGSHKHSEETLKKMRDGRMAKYHPPRAIFIKNGVAEVTLSLGQTALIDIEDAAWASKFNWYAKRRHKNDNYDAVTTIQTHNREKRKCLSLARGILGVVCNKTQVDHIDGNPLNNRRSNLRLCNNVENLRNVGKKSTNTSGYIGVGRSGNNFVSSVTKDRIVNYIGSFKTAKEAAIARDKLALKLHGEFARLNFPELRGVE